MKSTAMTQSKFIAPKTGSKSCWGAQSCENVPFHMTPFLRLLVGQNVCGTMKDFKFGYM